MSKPGVDMNHDLKRIHRLYIDFESDEELFACVEFLAEKWWGNGDPESNRLVTVRPAEPADELQYAAGRRIYKTFLETHSEKEEGIHEYIR